MEAVCKESFRVLGSSGRAERGFSKPKHQGEIKMGHKSTFTPLYNRRRGTKRASCQESYLHQTLGMAHVGSLGKGLKS